MYKLSDYNFVIPFEDRVIYLNGISLQIFSLSQTEHKKIEGFFHDLISFEINFNSIFNQFRKWGFIVSDDLNEIEIIRFRNRKAVFEDKMYRIIINPTLECNFGCWYCYEKHPQGRMTEQTLGKIKRHILHMIEQVKITALHLSWFGGEPLLYFDEIVYPLSLYAQQVCEYHHIPFLIGITTNASKITSEMIEKMKNINLSSFQITIDGDKNRHDKIRNENGRATFDKILNNIVMICKYLSDVRVTLRINYDDQTLKKSNLIQVLDTFPQDCRDKITVDLQRVWQTAKKCQTDNKERINLYDYCDQLGFAQCGVGSNIFSMGKYNKCYADKYWHTEINYDGKIYRCTARGYDDKYIMGILGDDGIIRWNEREMARRYSKAPFENEQCLKCKYLPLCLGPCSQKVAENRENNRVNLCYMDTMEIRPETIIIDYYKRKMKTLKS